MRFWQQYKLQQQQKEFAELFKREINIPQTKIANAH